VRTHGHHDLVQKRTSEHNKHKHDFYDQIFNTEQF
jgi:hypothetical protein